MLPVISRLPEETGRVLLIASRPPEGKNLDSQKNPNQDESDEGMTGMFVENVITFTHPGSSFHLAYPGSDNFSSSFFPLNLKSHKLHIAALCDILSAVVNDNEYSDESTGRR